MTFWQREIICASGVQSVSVITSAIIGRSGIAPSSSIAERRRACADGIGIAGETRTVRADGVAASGCSGTDAGELSAASSRPPRVSTLAATTRTAIAASAPIRRGFILLKFFEWSAVDGQAESVEAPSSVRVSTYPVREQPRRAPGLVGGWNANKRLVDPTPPVASPL